MSSRENHEAEFLAEEIQRRSTQCSGGQSLFHCGERPFVGAEREKFDLLIRIHAEMLEDQPSHHFDISAESVEADGLSPKLLNGFKLSTGDERERSAGHVAGHDLYRHSLQRSCNAGPIPG